MKRFLLFCLAVVFTLASTEVWAQERTVSGRVTDSEDGAALPGVSVVLKGTTVGTVTDADGNYRLSVPQQGGTLSFSFIGRQSQEVEIGSRASIDIQLVADATELTEVVVTGLGWQQESRTLGYAVAKVNTETINQAKAMNAFQGLSGKVAGLQIRTTNNGINPATRITLRGNRSLTGNNQALVVLDGIIVPNNTLNSINNMDIENVTILKGASASAIYGSQASNGVLLVTLRKGTNTAPRIDFSHTTTLEQVSYMPQFQTGWGPGTNNYSRGYISYENQSYGDAFDGSERQLGKTLEDGSVQVTRYAAAKDNKREVWDIGVTNQNYISFSAGDDDSRFDMSLQDVIQKGVVPRDQYRRSGGRIAGSQNVGKFQGSYSLLFNVIGTDQNASPNGFYWDVINSGANIDIKSYRHWRNFQNADGSLNYANPNNYFNDYYENPWFGLDAYRVKNRGTELTGNTQINYKPTDWLNLTARVGLTSNSNYGKTTGEKFQFRDWAAGRDPNNTTGGIYRARADIPGFVTDFANNFRKTQFDFIATIAKSFEKFDLQIITGTQAIDDFSKNMNIGTTNIVAPGIYNVTNRTGEPIAGESNFNVRSFGVFGDITATYNDILTLHLSGRNDQTSLLAKGNNSFFYPAFDVAFVASDAIPGLKDNRYLNYAKLTAGYAKVGQVNIGPYGLQPTFNLAGGFPYGSLPGFSVSNVLPDPDLQPEFSRTVEFTLDTKLFDERISLNLGYYKTNTDNQTVQISTSSATGYSLATINAGEIENSGFEVELGAKLFETAGGLTVGVDANYANRSTEVISLYQGLDEINIGQTTGQAGNNVYAIVGQQYPVVKVDRYLRDNQGRVVVDAETGYPLEDQTGLFVAGQTEPRHIFGMTPYLKFKGFELYITAEYRTGAVIWNNSGESMTFTGVAKITDTYGRERFVFPNSVIATTNSDGSQTYVPNTTVAVEDGGLGFWDNHFDAISENYVTSADFWKIREVSLSYGIPSSFLANTKIIKKATVSIVGRNLLMFLPESNLYTDPEFNLGTGNVVGVNSIAITPPTRTYGFSVDLRF